MVMYEKPEMEIIELVVDIITTSDPNSLNNAGQMGNGTTLEGGGGLY